MPRDLQSEAVIFACDARSVISWATTRLDSGQMALPEYVTQLDAAIGLLGRALARAKEAQARKDQLSLPV